MRKSLIALVLAAIASAIAGYLEGAALPKHNPPSVKRPARKE